MLQLGAPNPSTTPHNADLVSQPSYLRRHVKLGSNQDDDTVPLSSIDASQAHGPASSSCSPTTLTHLPAELLLLIVEFVPVDYVLDWRLVCRSFRDAIDGRVLHQYLHRTRLLGYPLSTISPVRLGFDDYLEPIRMLEARFSHMEKDPGGEGNREKGKKDSTWSDRYAVFRIDEEWYRALDRIREAEKRQSDPVVDVWRSRLKVLELSPSNHINTSEFGVLSWCIALDHAVLDLDFPTEKSRMNFEIDISVDERRIRVAWKDMLVRFLKTERALRVLLEEKRTYPKFTFSHTEDCLRAVRRARLCASLNPNDESDREISVRLQRELPPLFGFGLPHHKFLRPSYCWFSNIERGAIYYLLLLRRSALLPPEQLSYLQGLASDFRKLEFRLRCIEEASNELGQYLSTDTLSLSCNPVAWSDEVREKIEWLVLRWREQGEPLEKLKTLVEAGYEAMCMSEDESDDVEGSEITSEPE